MKRMVTSGLIALYTAALATNGFAQNQQNEQDPRFQQDQQPQQSPQQQSQQQQSQQQQSQGQRQQGQQEPLADVEPGASVILSGDVAAVEEDKFTLDYGQGDVTVELDDWDWSGDLQNRLSEGQQVTVSGTVDENWFEQRTIEADNIYLSTEYTYYYIVDENPAYSSQQSQRETQQDGTFISTRGEVKEVSEDQITVESQGNTIQVDLSELDYDPLDEQGMQQIKQGDRIYVFGDIDENFFETKTISAESLITLSQAGQPREQMDQQQDQQNPQQNQQQN
ncbi:MAG: hypothetical protein WDZ30_02095 [Cellvibrionaceae bacterium]